MFITVQKSLKRSENDVVHVGVLSGRFIPRCLRVIATVLRGLPFSYLKIEVMHSTSCLIRKYIQCTSCGRVFQEVIALQFSDCPE